eukprot:17804-Chlamydomonas_euryale.AAC.2
MRRNGTRGRGLRERCQRSSSKCLHEQQVTNEMTTSVGKGGQRCIQQRCTLKDQRFPSKADSNSENNPCPHQSSNAAPLQLTHQPQPPAGNHSNSQECNPLVLTPHMRPFLEPSHLHSSGTEPTAPPATRATRFSPTPSPNLPPRHHSAAPCEHTFPQYSSPMPLQKSTTLTPPSAGAAAAAPPPSPPPRHADVLPSPMPATGPPAVGCACKARGWVSGLVNWLHVWLSRGVWRVA